MDQADAGRQAGKREDGGQQNGARLTEKLEHDAAERPRAVLLNGIDT